MKITQHIKYNNDFEILEYSEKDSNGVLFTIERYDDNQRLIYKENKDGYWEKYAYNLRTYVRIDDVPYLKIFDYMTSEGEWYVLAINKEKINGIPNLNTVPTWFSHAHYDCNEQDIFITKEHCSEHNWGKLRFLNDLVRTIGITNQAVSVLIPPIML